MSLLSGLAVLFLIGIPVFVALCVGEVFLSLTKPFWPGLVLPALSLLVSLSGTFVLLRQLGVKGALLFIVLCLAASGLLFLVYGICRAVRGRSARLSKAEELKSMAIQDLD